MNFMELTKKEDFAIYFMTGSTSREHMHQDVEFIYCMEGSIRVTTLGKDFVLKPEDTMVINSNHRHSWLELEKSHVCVLHFDYAMLMEYLDKKLLFFYCNSAMENSDRYEGIRAIMGDLLSECAINMDRMTFLKKSLIYRLLQYLVRYFMADEVSGSASSDDMRIEKMLQYINTNYNRTLTLQEMAEFMYMAPSSFSRFFKRRVGMNFVEYVNNVRLHFALEDICYTNNPVAWIAENHGFTNASAFCRIFKNIYGVSPMIYRKNLSQQSNAQEPQDMDRQFLKKYNRQSDKQVWQSWKTRFVQVNVDSREFELWKNPWGNALNLGNAPELLSVVLQNQIIMAKDELEFSYGRINNLFSSEMCLRPGHSLHINNFVFIDVIVDFLVDNRIRPVICLDNKPIAITKGVNTHVYEKKSEKIFDDLTECRSVLEDFLRHIIQRYGMNEVEQWLFECWYDEYYENTMGIPGLFSNVFNGIYRTIKTCIPGAAVGGCGLSIAISETKFRDLIDVWSKEPERPDFISINLFPYIRDDVDGKLQGRRRLNSDAYYRGEVLRCRDVIDEFGWSDVPLFVAEWNMSMSQRNYFNESCGKAALMVQQMCSLSGHVDFAAYMRLSDYSGVYHDTNAFLTGGYGLVSAAGVRKPAYYALKFMGQLGRMLIARDKDYIITTNGFNDFTILCFNAKQLRYKYYVKDENNIGPEAVEDIFEDDDSLEITFTLRNVPEGTYQVKEYKILPGHGSALEEWQRLGMDAVMDAKDADYLRQRCIPEQKNGHVKASRGKLVFLQSLKAQEIKLIRVFQ